MNYKEEDIQKIRHYISVHDQCTVEDIMSHSGAEKLRVYSILFELEQAGEIEVTERSFLGAAKKVKAAVS